MQVVDAIDGRLLAHLVRDPLAGTGELCETAGLTPNATRARLERLRERGILWGTRAVPNPVLFDRTSIVAIYETPPDGNPQASRLLDVEDVTAVSRNYDDRLAAICWLEGPDADTPEQLDRLMGAPPTRRFVERSEPLEPPGTVLSATQWTVMAELVPDPRIPTGQLAAQAQISAKRARRLRDWLVRGNHLKVETILQEDQGGETMFCEVYAQGPAAAQPADVQRVLPASWVISRVKQPVGVLLLYQVSHIGEAVAARDRVADLDGIDHAEIVLGVEFHWAPEPLKALCRAKAAEAVDRRRTRSH